MSTTSSQIPNGEGIAKASCATAPERAERLVAPDAKEAVGRGWGHWSPPTRGKCRC
jgi:hypothetical protein